MNIAYIDIGNSNTKIRIDGVFNSVNNNDICCIINELDIITAVISSVNTATNYELVNALKHKGVKMVVVTELLAKQTLIDFSNISGMGNDRILGLIGAISKYKPPLVTIDCGTATTINVLGNDGVCLGGVIMPGIGSMARSLNDYTSGLPLVEVADCNENYFGKNTQDAIKYGIISATIGAIDQILFKASEYLENSDMDVVITGGYGDLIRSSNYWSGKLVHYDEQLVLLGMEYLFATQTNFL